MDKKNWLILGAILLLAGILFLVSGTLRESTSEDMVIISVDGEEYGRYPLEERTVTIEQEDGCVNVIEINAQGARMLSSSCKNQLCVQMDWVTLENWEIRPNGAFVICLPNRITVELAVKE